MSFKFHKGERLKKRKIIERLFNKEGRSFAFHPIRIIYLKTELNSEYPAQFAFSVPKRAFPRAVHRNRIKRQIKEVCRLHKHLLTDVLQETKQQYAIIFLYTGKKALPYVEIERNVISIFKKLSKKV